MTEVKRRSAEQSAEHFTERNAIGLVALVVAGTGFGVLLVLVQYHLGPLERLDHNVANGLNRLVADRPAVVGVLRGVTRLGANAVLWGLVTVSAASLLIRRQFRLAIFLIVTGLGALALDPTLKVLVGRLRPVVAEPIAAGVGNSFPSGHALNSTVCYGALLLVYLPIIPRRWRRWVIGLVIALVAAIGFSRVALGVHYMSDVVAGWLLGIAWLAVTTYAFRRWRLEIGRPAEPLSDGLEPEAAPQLRPRIVHVEHPLLSAGALIAVWVLIMGAMFWLGRFVVHHAPGFDEAVPRWFADRRTPGLNSVSAFWSQVGNTHAILTLALVIGSLGLAITRRWRPAVFVAVVLIGEFTLFITITAAVGRARPLVTQLDGKLPTSSFPSGHAAATTCLYAAFAVLAVPRTRGVWRWLVIAVAVLVPALVVTSRMYRGEHHPIDVTAGVVLALLWVTAVTLAIRPNADLQDRTQPATAGVPTTPEVAGEIVSPAAAQAPMPRSAVVANPTKLVHHPAVRAELQSALADADWAEPAWLDTTADDPGLGQAQRAIADGADVVFAAGGDGTVRACASALADTAATLAILPLGTGNLLAANLRIPTRIRDAIATATAHHRQHLDLGQIDGQSCFTVMAGMGLDAEMIHDAPERLKADVGWLAYAFATVKHVCARPMHVEIRLDHNAPVRREARTVLVGNVGRLQGGMSLLPNASPTDGLLDIAVVMPPRRRDWARLTWALLRHRTTAPDVETFQAKHVEINSDRVQPRELDGDLIAPSRMLAATVRPASLWVYVPQPS